MATVPVMDSWGVGEAPTAAKLNRNIKDAINFLLDPPRCSLEQSAAQSIPSSAFTAITFDVELVDNDSMFTAGTGVTVQTPGLYLITGLISFAASATGNRYAAIYVNGSARARTLVPGAATQASALQVSDTLRLLAGDVVTLQAWQSSGAALNTSVSSAERPRLRMTWAGK